MADRACRKKKAKKRRLVIDVVQYLIALNRLGPSQTAYVPIDQ